MTPDTGIAGVDIYRFDEDGKAAEHWDALELVGDPTTQLLGSAEPPPSEFAGHVRKHDWKQEKGNPMTTRTGLGALLAPERSVLLLIDHQPFQFSNLHSHEPTLIINNVVGLAKAAKAFKVPTILTTVTEERGGQLLKGLQEVFPTQQPINRTFINTWEDERVVAAVKKTGRKQLVVAALWTDICLAMPVIQSLADGYDVFFVTDASGAVSREAHDMAILRMVQAGAVPVTWIAVMSEWQRDWAREATIPAVAEVTIAHGGASGVAFAWEQQLLNSGRK